MFVLIERHSFLCWYRKIKKLETVDLLSVIFYLQHCPDFFCLGLIWTFSEPSAKNFQASQVDFGNLQTWHTSNISEGLPLMAILFQKLRYFEILFALADFWLYHTWWCRPAWIVLGVWKEYGRSVWFFEMFLQLIKLPQFETGPRLQLVSKLLHCLKYDFK